MIIGESVINPDKSAATLHTVDALTLRTRIRPSHFISDTIEIYSYTIHVLPIQEQHCKHV
jgi:hypothetical protein